VRWITGRRKTEDSSMGRIAYVDALYDKYVVIHYNMPLLAGLLNSRKQCNKEVLKVEALEETSGR